MLYGDFTPALHTWGLFLKELDFTYYLCVGLFLLAQLQMKINSPIKKDNAKNKDKMNSKDAKSNSILGVCDGGFP